MHCMPQSTTPTPFKAPIPAILHFDLLNFRPEIFRNLSKAFKISVTDVWFLTKKKASLTYAVYKKSCSNILNLSIF